MNAHSMMNDFDVVYFLHVQRIMLMELLLGGDLSSHLLDLRQQ